MENPSFIPDGEVEHHAGVPDQSKQVHHRTPALKDGKASDGVFGDSEQRKEKKEKKPADKKDVAREPVILKREIGLFRGVCMSVGVIIGSGIFVSPTSVLSNSGSVGLCLIVWTACGFMSLVGGLAFMELGTMIPKSAGDYMYLKEGLGDVPAFLSMWVSVAALGPSSKAIIFLTFAKYAVAAFCPSCQVPHITYGLIACASLCLSAFINCYSVKWVAKVVTLFTILKVSALIIIIGGGVYRLSTGHVEYLATGFEGTTTSYGNIATAFYSSLWAYGGWNQMTEIMEEVKNPIKTLPRNIIISISLVTVLYVLVNIAYLTVLSPAEMTQLEVVAVVYGERVLGPMSFLMPLSVAISILGSSISSQFSGGRLLYVAAREGHLMNILSYIHVRRLTPTPSFIFSTAISAIMMFNSDIFPLINFLSFTASCFSSLVMISLLVMRYTKKDVPRPYKAPILAPIIMLLMSLYLVVAPMMDNPKKEYAYGVVLIATGLIVYVPFVYYKKRVPGMDKFTIMCQKLLESVPPEYIPD